MDAEFPPILVHRSTGRIIDGMHRVRAARLRGEDTIAARFFDGGDDLAFVLAVEANVRHGLPLSLADRRAAASRVIATQRSWSDRAVATVIGLSPHTVAKIRGQEPAPAARLGRDGRLRPVDSAAGRRIATEVIRRNPQASLREVARVAGVSPATVLNIRQRLARGEEPVGPPAPTGGGRGQAARATGRRSGPADGQPSQLRDRDAALRELAKDPSLRYTEKGRELVRWLNIRTPGPESLEVLAEMIPPHCTYLVSELANACAQWWIEFAGQVAARADVQVSGPHS
jgi:ParB-like chromosome segregation protein Spo0J